MIYGSWYGWQLKLAGWVVFVGVVVGGDRALAQVTADPSLGTTVTVNGNTFEITNGTTVGDKNLFHSFSNFSIPNGGTAHFVNAPAITNILARVTGGNPSDIQGLIRAQGSANLFLMNPNGILFGPNAQLDLGGSFVATTANAIQFPGGVEFAQNSLVTADNSLLSVNPSAFLFNQIAAQPITNQSIQGLQVPDGQSLLLLGGKVSLDGGALYARSGRVELGGVATGTVGLNVDDNNLLLSYPIEVQRADVVLTNGAGIEVTSGGGGSIAVNAQNLDISGGSYLFAGIGSELGSPGSVAGDVTLDATGVITVTGSGIFNYVGTEATGNAGSISATAKTISLADGARLVSNTFGQGNAGSITVKADASVSLSGGTPLNKTQIASVAGSINVNPETVRGNSGNITIQSSSLFMSDRAVIETTTFGQGNAGSISVDADNVVSLAGTPFGVPIIVSQIGNGGVGRGGDINIRAKFLSMAGGAVVRAGTSNRGDAGNIHIYIDDSISLTDNLTFIATDVSGEGFDLRTGTLLPPAIGKGGNITIQARSLTLTDGAYLSASTQGDGNAGDIEVKAADFVNIGGISSRIGLSSGMFTTTEKTASGQGGDIQVFTRSLQIADGAVLSARTKSKYRAGNITVDTNTVEFTRGGQILSTALSGGYAGNITINATDSITLSGNDPAFITRLAKAEEVVSTLQGFNYDIDVSDIVNNSGASSGLYVQSGGMSSDKTTLGKGGNISITARALFLTDNAQLSANSFGQKDAGNIFVNLRDSMQIKDSTISTTSESTSGGMINVITKEIRLSGNSDITTSVFSGAGGGGDINLTADSIIAFNDSDILAFALEGQGGNITLNTPVFFGSSYRPGVSETNYAILDGNDRVDINASGAIASGNITTPDTTFIQNSLTELPANVIDTSTLVANSCIARSSDRQQGNFIITGSGGLPTRPGDITASSYPTGTVRSIPSDRAIDAIRLWQIGDPIVEPQGAYRLPNGQLVLSRECF